MNRSYKVLICFIVLGLVSFAIDADAMMNIPGDGDCIISVDVWTLDTNGDPISKMPSNFETAHLIGTYDANGNAFLNVQYQIHMNATNTHPEANLGEVAPREFEVKITYTDSNGNPHAVQTDFVTIDEFDATREAGPPIITQYDSETRDDHDLPIYCTEVAAFNNEPHVANANQYYNTVPGLHEPEVSIEVTCLTCGSNVKDTYSVTFRPVVPAATNRTMSLTIANLSNPNNVPISVGDFYTISITYVRNEWLSVTTLATELVIHGIGTVNITNFPLADAQNPGATTFTAGQLIGTTNHPKPVDAKASLTDANGTTSKSQVLH